MLAGIAIRLKHDLDWTCHKRRCFSRSENVPIIRPITAFEPSEV